MKFVDTLTDRYITPRSQKATGVLVLQNDGWPVPMSALVQQEASLEDAFKSMRYVTRFGGSKLFARPCPVRPRHGFVDSQVVETLDDARAVFAKAVAADPEAEMLLMQAIDAKWNAVWVPGKLAIGPGHDGATSGHDSFTIPLAQLGSMTMDHISSQANITSPEVPYVEAVADSSSVPFFVQVRAGPAVESNGTDYIPIEMTVEHVVRAGGDLLEWESLAKTFAPNTVVWHPGGSLASHYAVHCVLNKIPIVISHRPRKGDVIAPTLQKPPVNMDSVLSGIGAGTMIRLKEDRRAAVAAMLTGFHNVSAYSGNDGFWLGAACAIMQRLGGAALLGEARHAGNRLNLSREAIYDRIMDIPFVVRRRLRKAQWLFQNYRWDSSYGGSAWAACGDALIDLDEQIRLFVQAPTEAQYRELAQTLNVAVNQAHNGGWWLDKFCEANLMDQAANGDPRAAISGMSTLATLRSISAEKIEAALAMWDAARKIAMPCVENFSSQSAATKKVAKSKYMPKYMPTYAYTQAPSTLAPSTLAPYTQAPSIQNYTVSINSPHWLVNTDSPTTNLATYTIDHTCDQAEAKPTPKAKIIQAQGRITGKQVIHIQYKNAHSTHYGTLDVTMPPGFLSSHALQCNNPIATCMMKDYVAYHVNSWADDGKSTTPYWKLKILTGDGYQSIVLPWCHFELTKIQTDQLTDLTF